MEESSEASYITSNCICASNITNSQSTNNNNQTIGCGCENITVFVTPTTGGQFNLAVPKNESIEYLKKLISKKLKVPKERICLLYRERQLRDGTVQENQLVDGSRLTLLPSVETGLLAQRPEQSVMQALESLNDAQVNDFLSGKAPLNLTMRLGDHMMLIQLQLSTVAPNVTSTSTTPTATPASINPLNSNNNKKLGFSNYSSNSNSNKILNRTSSTSSFSTDCSRCKNKNIGDNGKLNSEMPTSSAMLDTRALAEASRNLTQTLKQLSSEVLTSRSSSSHHHHSSNYDSVRTLSRRPGAIIESMHHHGKGVYSGTFSGTLNPALQDKFGRPKRDISTIIHILNDLLCATPQYRALETTINAHDGPSSSGIATTSASATTTAVDDLSINETSETAIQMDEVEDIISNDIRKSVKLDQTAKMSDILVNDGATEQLTSSGILLSAGDEDSDENRATRGKMERLRLVLGQRRERRRAMRAQPYSTARQGPGAPPPTTPRDHVIA